jgi:hypothetical protein
MNKERAFRRFVFVVVVVASIVVVTAAVARRERPDNLDFKTT